MNFMDFNAPIFDTKTNYIKEERRDVQRNLLAVGCEKGFIVILDLAKMKHFHSRFNPHREEIVGSYLNNIFDNS
jgi:hypothetical protein